jgi:chromosome segregation ATPase
MASQIDDLQERLKDSSSKVLTSENILKGKESRIEELEKELASLRERHAKSSQDKDEAVALVKSRDAQKELQDILVPSTRNATTESKNNWNGSSVKNKAGASKSATAPDQLRFKTKHISEMHPVDVSTGPFV